ncbi:MAG: ABC transporter ATP-binding protein [Myxococcota bacterium]|nr:ABC transporter ATP-binding protein [Myxococcota bacterium]
MSSPLLRLLRRIDHHRRQVWLAALCSVLNKIFDLAPPVLIGAALDVVVEQEDSLLAQLGVTDVVHQLVLLAALTVLVWGLESVFEYAFAWLWRTLAQTVQHELRLDAYAHIQDLDMAWFAERSRGGLMSVLNDDINQLERFLDGGANNILQVATTAVVVGATFFGVSAGVAVWAIAPVPLILWGSFRFQKTIAPRYAAVREKVGALNAILANNLSGIATIKSFTSEEREVARLSAASEAYRSANKQAIAVSSAFSPLIRMAIVIGFTATMVYGGWLAIHGEIAAGAYTVLVFLTQRLLWPLTRLGETFDLYQRAMASTTRVLDLLDTPVQITDGETVLTEVKGDVCFQDISFAYPERPPLLADFSLTIPAGRTVAIVGSTGSGKSTLLRLLLRFFDVDSGQVTLDGHDVRDLTLASLRQSVGVVSQHVFLFPGTVRDNIVYGRTDATDDAVFAAAKLAEAHDFISALPQGYDTVIGEQGQKLSGGQRQRLSIARAVLTDAPILALDEATSAVDNDTEAAIQRSMRKLAEGRTTIVIAHRLSTIRHADEIVVMEGGVVVERGRHEELADAGGRYARLWAVQTGTSDAA